MRVTSTVQDSSLVGNHVTWQVLCGEIRALSHPVLSYIEDVDVLEGLDHTV